MFNSILANMSRSTDPFMLIMCQVARPGQSALATVAPAPTTVATGAGGVVEATIAALAGAAKYGSLIDVAKHVL